MYEASVHLDFETYSALDLKKVGAPKYARDPSTEVLICCYATGDGPIHTWLPHKQAMPSTIRKAAADKSVLFIAHNADFEREICTHVLKLRIPRARWRCTAVRSAAAGLPRSLGGVLLALGGIVQKDTRGKALIRVFCKPRKPTKKNLSLRVLPDDEPEKFAEFVAYCQNDVRSERALDKRIPDLTKEEWRYYHYNMLLNDRGLPLDVPNIAQTVKVVRALEQDAVKRVMELTGGIRPTQGAKMLEWLRAQGVDIVNLQLKTIVTLLEEGVPEYLRQYTLPPAVREVLELRLESSKASTKKLVSMAAVACNDYRARGTILHYGAHTGRQSGKLIQPHNFKRGTLKPEQMIAVLEAFAGGDVQWVRMLYEKPMLMLSESMRGFIRAEEGHRFLIADYSAIETRVLAWLANEVKLLAIYHRNMTLPKDQQIDLYKMMASVLYRKPYASISKESEERRIGKNLRLGAGFQLGTEGLLMNCEKESIPMTKEFAQFAIRAYREDNPNIVRLWYDTEAAALETVGTRRPHSTAHGLIQYECWKDWLICNLPSGRKMYYYDPKIVTVRKFKKMKQALTYFGERKKGVMPGLVMPGQGARVQTYGGKEVENYVQATARDFMMFGMICAERVSYPVLANVHDEIITMRKHGEGSVHELEQVICTLPPYAKGLPLVAEGFECERYRKG